MARGNDSGLYALLDAMARRDQISESRMDRELRRDQLLLTLEEIRGQNAMNRERMTLERAKFSAQFEIEKAKTDVERRRAELDFRAREMEMNLQLNQLRIAQQQADDAHKRNEIDLDMVKDNRARAQLEDYRNYRNGVVASRAALVEDLDKERIKNGEAYAAVLSTFGTVVDGKFEFLDSYKHLYDGYVRGSGLPKGTSQEAVARVWAEEFSRQYRDSLNMQLEAVNANRRAQGQPEYTSEVQLDQVTKQSILDKAYRDWMTGKSGPLVAAARGSMSQSQYDSLVKKHGGNENMVNTELLSMIRFSKGRSMTVGEADLEGYMDPNRRGNKEVAAALSHALMSFGPTAGQAVSDLVSSADNISNFANRYALLSKEEMVYSALERQASANLVRDRGPLTKEQENAIKALNTLSWEAIGLPSSGVDQDGKAKDSSAALPWTGNIFSVNWLAAYKGLIVQNTVDAHALADSTQEALSDPQSGSAAVENVTGQKIQIPMAPQKAAGPWSAPAPAQFMDKGQASLLKSTVESSVQKAQQTYKSGPYAGQPISIAQDGVTPGSVFSGMVKGITGGFSKQSVDNSQAAEDVISRRQRERETRMNEILYGAG